MPPALAPAPSPALSNARPAVLIALASVVVLTGCSRSHRSQAPAVLELGSSVAEARYLAPPRIDLAVSAHDGATMVTGHAAPAAQVGFSSPEGETYAARANAAGIWMLRLPPSPRPRLYALSSRQGGRAVHAEGAVLTFPQSRLPAVMVRAGAAAIPLGAVNGGVSVLSLDYDQGGFAGVSGAAAPRTEVKLGIDGTLAGEGQADANGRFALLAATRRLDMAPHALTVATPGGTVERRVQLSAVQPMSGPYRVDGGPGAWRVQWALNGGGVQTTLLIPPPP